MRSISMKVMRRPCGHSPRKHANLRYAGVATLRRGQSNRTLRRKSNCSGEDAMRIAFGFYLQCLAFIFLFVHPASAACDRQCLRSVTDQYLKALLAHNPALAPLANSVKYTENGSIVKPGEGIWKTA